MQQNKGEIVQNAVIRPPDYGVFYGGVINKYSQGKNTHPGFVKKRRERQILNLGKIRQHG